VQYCIVALRAVEIFEQWVFVENLFDLSGECVVESEFAAVGDSRDSG
jgi:hypothetical protein